MPICTANLPTQSQVVVVGGGPVGIETAISLQAVGIETQVVEAGAIGHTISWWAPQTRWFSSNDRISIAGVPLRTIDQAKATREEYLHYLRTVVEMFGVSVRSHTKVVGIQSLPNVHGLSDAGVPMRFRFELSGTSRDVVEANAVVLAVGGTDKPNRLNVPGENLAHVDGYLREVHRYFGRRVLIVGGRNSAVEAAIRLHRVGAKVALSYRRKQLPSDNIKYWLRPEIEGLIASGAVEAYFNTQVAEISPNDVVLVDVDDSKIIRRVVVDDVLTLIGYRQDSFLFDQLGIQREGDARRPMFDPSTMQTHREGVYVAGTAIGGTQSSSYQVFLENCHDHCEKIASHLSQQIHGKALKKSLDGSACGLNHRIELHPES